MGKDKSKNSNASLWYNPNSLALNFAVAALCLLGIGISLYLFRLDFLRSLERMDEQPVGVVSWKTNLTQRLAAGRVNWDRLTQYSQVFEGDTVKTGDFSQCRINFTNGETIELSPNSLIRIFYKTDDMSRFELPEGEIRVVTDRFSVIVTGEAENESISLNSKTSAGIMALNGLILNVFQGSASFFAAGETRRAQAGNVVHAGEDGRFSAESRVVMLSPGDGERILRSSDSSAPVEFMWREANSRDIRLEISRFRDFSQIVSSWYEEAADSATLDLGPGRYYWRAYVPPNPEAADSGYLEIVNTQKPQPLFPADGSTVALTPGTLNLRFVWAVSGEASEVLLEAADNPDMRNPRIKQRLERTSGSGGSYITSDLQPGTWYWRIQPLYPNGVQGDDQILGVNGFTLVQPREAPQNSTPAALPKDEGAPLRPLFPPDNFTVEASRAPDITFNWQNPYPDSLKFQVSPRSDFEGSLIIDDIVFGTSTIGRYLKAGVYYWRVLHRGQGQDNETQPMRLVITPALEAPELISPASNSNVKLEEEGKPVIFSWDRVNYANYYTFSLYLEGRSVSLTEISSLRTNSVNVYFDSRTSGRFRWHVQGFSLPTEYATGRTGLISSGNFTITPAPGSSVILSGEASWSVPRIANIQSYSGEVRSPMALVSPAVGTNIQGIDALRSPSLAEWSSQEPLLNVQLLVSQTADPMSDPKAIVMDAGSGARSMIFPALSEGIWYWTVRADTAVNQGVTPGDPWWFTVLPIPLLPAPEVIQPGDETVIGIIQLTQDKNITFRWNEVPGANTYIFNFYREGEPHVLLLTGPSDASTTFVLDDLTLLDEAVYIWQVEAVYRNRSGVIEQRGAIEQHRFAIEIQRSNTLRTRQSQGTLYGQ